jgi:hypothetical protein
MFWVVSAKFSPFVSFLSLSTTMGKRSSKKAKGRGDEDRFDASKPQFRKPKERDQKVVLDKRFASVLTDERFQVKVRDKYGRRQGKHKDSKDELSAFYTVEKGDQEISAVNPTDGQKEGSGNVTERKRREATRYDKEDDHKEGDQENPSSRIAYLTALSRGQLDLSSSSSSPESSSEDEGDDDASEAVAGTDDLELDTESSRAGVLDPSSREEDVEITHEPTPFLAVCNLDWSHVRAVDVFALLVSFSPPGAVKRVQVFVSDFGKERLAEEERLGPSEIWKDDDRGVDDDSEASGSGTEGNGTGRGASDGGSSDNDSRGIDSGEDDSQNEEPPYNEDEYLPKGDHVDSGFDREKLRAYEAAKLRYYFAVAEFTSPAHADAAYRDVDGMEFEHSSAAVDLRAIQPSDLDDVIRDRDLRDEASSLPSNYVPPDFVVGALQQTNLQCTWEAGDRDRERTLTKYSSGSAWQALAESDDLKAYLASDASSDEVDDSDNEKASSMRRLLGLEDDDDEEEEEEADEKVRDKTRTVDPASSGSSSSSESGSEDQGQAMSKEVVFIPGQKKESLERKIRYKLTSNTALEEELTPWQKYQQKRKEKRRERRLASQTKRHSAKESGGQAERSESDDDSIDHDSSTQRPTLEELELLLAGEENDEETRDYDMRELRRVEKLKDKKLRGSRKRKEEDRAASVSGADFKVDLQDERFKAVLEGHDDRYGIDRTDPRYKETPAMKQILTEQARRRKSKKPKVLKDAAVVPNVNADGSGLNTSAGAAALSALVTRIKSKVSS